VPPEADAEDLASFGPDTTMAALQSRGEMTIALPDDLGPFSSIGEDGEAEGFVAELAGEIVEALGVDATYVAAPGDEGLELVNEGEVDLAFPMLGVTERLARAHNFSGPYWIAHKRLLVPTDSDIDDVEGLSGEAVCQYEEEDTAIDIQDLGESIDIREAAHFGDCIEPLEDERVVAASAPDIYLIALADSLGDHEIRGEQLSTIGYSVAVPPDAADMSTFVNRVLTETKSEGRWLEYYDEWLASIADLADASAPDLTLEEVATLWPRSLER
jgi:polar amino acid transport system substrate-binding protein